ncbi:MAG: hypothetical protein RIM80_03090 [Alphaproteobacteria bacterium]
MTRLGEALWSASLAFRLGRFDASAVDAFQDDDRTFWRSFWALPVALLLGFVATRLMLGAIGAEAGMYRRSPASIAWDVTGALLSLAVAAEFARAVGKAERWPRYVVAQNWASLAQTIVLTLALLGLAMLGAASDFVQFAMLAIGFWKLAFDWYVAKTALQITGGQAALLTAVLLALSLVLDRLAYGFATA